MYQKEKSVLLKHFDFIILDVIYFQLAYIFAYMLRHGFIFPYTDTKYRELAIILVFVQFCVGFFMENYKNILRRGYFQEFKKTVFFCSTVIAIIFFYMFVTKTTEIFSRAVFLELWFLGNILIYVGRIIWKRNVQKRMNNKKLLQSLIVISTMDRIEETIKSMQERKYTNFYIAGIILMDKDNKSEEFEGSPIVAKGENAVSYLRECVVDEVFIDLSEQSPYLEELLMACEEMGITTHLNLGTNRLKNQNAIVENFAGHMVITSSIRFAEPRQLFIKRIMDIIGGIVGIVITILLTLILGPIIYIQSPAPIFFSQERVGRNGRKFRIYKFRSMYPDAEERKKELMKQNKMQGLMFKMDNDPRIIPIGKFIRKTSLDEFPQFFNVLKGDMSLVGTRPPTVDEYEQYETHHKARLAAKPGLTGMWQVSGRSDIVDFEEVVALDRKYIKEWSLGLDIKILLQTIKVVFTGRGSV